MGYIPGNYFPVQKTCMTPTKIWKDMVETLLTWESVEIHLERNLWLFALVEGAQKIVMLLILYYKSQQH